jgi:hypothetical protein
MLLDDDLPDAIPHAVLVPLVLAEKLLQRPHWNVRLQRDRLDALPLQIGQLPADIRWKMCPRVLSRETIVEPRQIPPQRRIQPANLVDIHASTSAKGSRGGTFVNLPKSHKANLAL